MFKINLLDYKFNSYLLLIFSLSSIIFEVDLKNQILFVLTLFFCVFQNLKNYKFKKLISSLVALSVIYFQFEFSDRTISKEFFINLILLFVFIKFSEIQNKQDHYFFNFTVIFLTISSLIYGQDFLSSINSIILMFIIIIHLYSLNQNKLININIKYILRYTLISFFGLSIIGVIYLMFPRYDINLKIFDTSLNNLGIPEEIKLGSFTDISNNDNVVFVYTPDENSRNELTYFRVKIFDFLSKEKIWIKTPKVSIDRHYKDQISLTKNPNKNIKKHKLIIYPNNKKWLPILNNYDYENRIVFNDYLNGTAKMNSKIDKKKILFISDTKFSVNFDANFLDFYTILSKNLFSEKLKLWSDNLRINSNSDIDYLNKLMDHFGNGDYYYTLSPTSDGNDDYEKFFFETKRGYCEYYAGMFTILARMQNIPSRIVTGYLGGQYNEIGNFYTFRQADAHSWVEVYLDDIGWKRFDPTLSIPKENILSFNNYSSENIQPNFKDTDKKFSKLDLIKLYYSYFDYSWTNKFLDYDKKTRDNFLREKINNIELNKKFYFNIISIFFIYLIYVLTKLIILRKILFNLMFKKIKKRYGILKNNLTHQQIFNNLSNDEKVDLMNIFEIYEKLKFSKNYSVNLKEFFLINIKIFKFSFFYKR